MLRGVTFDWKEPEKHGGHAETQTGFIAQEMEKVFPGWVSTDAQGFKSVDTHEIEALEVEAIRYLKDKSDADDAKIKSQDARIENLENGSHPIAAGFTSGLGISPGNLGLGLLSVLGCYFVSRKKKEEKAAA